jgi:hypothetical protein
MTPRPRSPARVLAVVVGAPVTAFAIGAVLVERLPIAMAVRFPVGAHAMLWSWVALVLALPLCSSGARAWAWCGAGITVAALLGLGAAT